MRKCWPLILVLILLAIALWPAGSARAAGNPADLVEVTAQVNTQAVSMGGMIQLQIRVNGSDSNTPPVMSALEKDFDVQLLGAQPQNSSSTTIINGHMTHQEFRGIIFVYELTPKRLGELTIPAIKVNVEQSDFLTQPIKIRVTPPQEDPDVRLMIEVDKQSPYVGEPIRLRVKLALQRNIDPPTFTIPGVEGAFQVGTPEDDGSTSRVAFELFRKPVQAKASRETIEGVSYSTFVAELPLVPLKAGEQIIGPAVVSCDVILRESDGFLDQGRRRTVSVPSNKLTVNVRELPSEGRPPNFSGLIGRFTLSATAEPTLVNVGDPITLHVMVNGAGPMERVPRPNLKGQLSGNGAFKVPEDMAAPTISRGQAAFIQTIRPMQPSVHEIPPIELDYFDTQAGAYATAKTNPIKITVADARVVTPADAARAPGEAAPDADAAAIKTQAGGIAANMESVAVLADQRVDLGEVVRSPMFLGVVGAPPVLYAGTAIVLLARRRSGTDVAKRRRRGALARAKSSLQESASLPPLESASAVSRAVVGFVADIGNRAEAGLTPPDCESVLAPRGAAAAKQVRELLERCDAARFAGMPPGELNELRARAISLMESLHAGAGGGH